MKNRLLFVLIFCGVSLVGCIEQASNELGKEFQDIVQKELPFTSVNYDSEHLKLQLNKSIHDPLSDVDWRWDYMTSDNSMPDSTGIDHYMNIDQPVFSFNGETTLPSLSITTDKNRIIEFSATVIFHLPDNNRESIESLMDSLTVIDHFTNESVRTSILKNGMFKKSNQFSEEQIVLNLGEEEYEYDRIIYSIKNKAI